MLSFEDTCCLNRRPPCAACPCSISTLKASLHLGNGLLLLESKIGAHLVLAIRGESVTAGLQA